MAGILVVVIIAIVSGAWRLTTLFKSETPPEKVPTTRVESSCASDNVIEDMSKELLVCYTEIDKCSKHLEAYIQAYIRHKTRENFP